MTNVKLLSILAIIITTTSISAAYAVTPGTYTWDQWCNIYNNDNKQATVDFMCDDLYNLMRVEIDQNSNDVSSMNSTVSSLNSTVVSLDSNVFSLDNTVAGLSGTIEHNTEQSQNNEDDVAKLRSDHTNLSQATNTHVQNADNNFDDIVDWINMPLVPYTVTFSMEGISGIDDGADSLYGNYYPEAFCGEGLVMSCGWDFSEESDEPNAHLTSLNMNSTSNSCNFTFQNPHGITRDINATAYCKPPLP